MISDKLIESFPWIKQFKEIVLYEASETSIFMNEEDDILYLANNGKGTCLNLNWVWMDILKMAQELQTAKDKLSEEESINFAGSKLTHIKTEHKRRFEGLCIICHYQMKDLPSEAWTSKYLCHNCNIVTIEIHCDQQACEGHGTNRIAHYRMEAKTHEN